MLAPRTARMRPKPADAPSFGTHPRRRGFWVRLSALFRAPDSAFRPQPSPSPQLPPASPPTRRGFVFAGAHVAPPSESPRANPPPIGSIAHPQMPKNPAPRCGPDPYIMLTCGRRLSSKILRLPNLTGHPHSAGRANPRFAAQAGSRTPTAPAASGGRAAPPFTRRTTVRTRAAASVHGQGSGTVLVLISQARAATNPTDGNENERQAN